MKPTNLADSYLHHYETAVDISRDVKRRVDEPLAEFQRREAVLHNKPMYGTRAHEAMLDIKKALEKDHWVKRVSNAVLGYPEVLTDGERRILKDKLVLYTLMSRVYDWRFRSLDPYIVWSSYLQAYILGCDYRSIYFDKRGTKVAQPEWAGRVDVGHVMGLFTTNLVEHILTSEGTTNEEWVISDMQECVEYALRDLEPQYHDDDVGYF